MEKVECGFSKTTNKDVFLTLTMNLDAIGPYCSGLGILRSTIADDIPMPSVRLELSHGAVGEIADMYSCAHDLLNALFPDKSAEEWKLVIKKTQAKRLRSKQKTKFVSCCEYPKGRHLSRGFFFAVNIFVLCG